MGVRVGRDPVPLIRPLRCPPQCGLQVPDGTQPAKTRSQSQSHLKFDNRNQISNYQNVHHKTPRQEIAEEAQRRDEDDRSGACGSSM